MDPTLLKGKEKENKRRPIQGKLNLTSVQKEAEMFHLSRKQHAYCCSIEGIRTVIR